MLKMVDGTGIIGVDMVCPLGVSTPQPPNYDRVELEGTGMLVLPNSLDAPLERLELGGKTEGKKQVIPVGEIEQGTVTAHAGNNYPSDYRVRTKSYINLTSGVYEVMCTGAKLGNVIFYSAENKYEKMLSETHIPLPIKFTLEENKTVRILFSNSESTPIAPTDIKNVILEADVSQEHQQEIVNVGKYNKDTGKYEVDVKVTGKNLFDKGSVKKGYEFSDVTSDMESPKEGWFVSDFIPVIKGKVYISGKSTGSGCKLYNKDKVFVENIQAPSGALTIKDGISYFRLNGEIKDLDNVQVEYGSVATSYEPYKKTQTLTLTSDRPITKWDRLVEQGGQIGWLYQSEIDADVRPSRIDLFPYGFNLYKNHENGTHTYNVTNIKKAIGFQTSYCKQFKNKDAAYQSAEMWHYSDQPSMKTQYFNTDIPTREEFIEWMESNPLTMVYKTEKTEFVPLPQEEQDAIRALKTYYPTTVITADGGELDPDIKATYRKEI